MTLNPDWSPDADVDADGSDYVWAYLHQGGRHDVSLKLSHFRHQDLHVELGRWTRQDPLRFVDGSSTYQAYVSGPVNGVDPNGLQSDRPGGGCGCGGACTICVGIPGNNQGRAAFEPGGVFSQSPPSGMPGGPRYAPAHPCGSR